MSWNLYVSNARRADAEQEVQNAAASPDSDAAEQAEQVQAAKDAAVAILKSGAVVNDDSQDVAITLGGHANPGHQAITGYAPDTVSITLTQQVRTQGDA